VETTRQLAYLHAVATASIERPKTHADEGQALAARDRMPAQVEAGSHPDRAATVDVLMQRRMDVAGHELSTRDTTTGYVLT